MDRKSLFPVFVLRAAPAFLLMACAFALPAASRPLYAARTGMACSRCHVNPAGGWMRSPTGFAYAVNKHTLTPAEEPEKTIEPKIADGLRLGADLRGMYLQGAHNPANRQSSFFLMSAVLFVEADVNSRMTIYYSNDQGRTFETYGLWRGSLPLDGVVKFGRFRPSYGLNEEDHSVYTEDSLGIAGSFSEDVGLELTMTHGIHHLTVGVVNGQAASTIDFNPQKAVVGRLWTYNSRAGIGLSGYANTPRSRHRVYRYGVLGNLHFGPVVFLGEYDRGENRDLTCTAHCRETVRVEGGLAEVSYQFDDGPTVKLKYDRFNRDMDVPDDARDRLGLWLETDLASLTRFAASVRGIRPHGKVERTVYEVTGQLYLFF